MSLVAVSDQELMDVEGGGVTVIVVVAAAAKKAGVGAAIAKAAKWLAGALGGGAAGYYVGRGLDRAHGR